MIFEAGPIIRKVLKDEGVAVKELEKRIPLRKIIRALNERENEVWREDFDEREQHRKEVIKAIEGKWHKRMAKIVLILLKVVETWEDKETAEDRYKRKLIDIQNTIRDWWYEGEDAN